MRIGVTGGSGFIGSQLISALDLESQVTVFERREKSGPLSMKPLKSFVKNMDLIYHLGGINRDTEKKILEGNTLSTLNLIQALKETQRPTRIIFASSAQVYSPKGTLKPIKESLSANPESIYGVAKKSAEEIIRLSGLDFTILRFSNVYGPGCRPYYNSVVATFCDRAARGQPIIINGDGTQGRDFIYVKDVVDAFIKTGKKFRKSGIYNVSSAKMISLRQIVKEVKKKAGHLKVEYIKDADPGGLSYCCDNTRFMKEYGWKPNTSLREGIAATFEWALKRI